MVEQEAVPLTLLQRVADGDAAAVDECLSEYGGLVWSLARKMCPRHEDAEDAVQEIFIEVWRKADNYDPDVASEATYITMIARRRLIDRYRRRSRDLDTTSIAEEVVVDDVEHERWIELSEEAEENRQRGRVLYEQWEHQLESHKDAICQRYCVEIEGAASGNRVGGGSTWCECQAAAAHLPSGPSGRPGTVPD